MLWSRRIPQRRLGALGEWRAAWFYRLRGYRVVARNVRGRRGEIDLVVRRGSLVVFVEVKTRQSTGAGEGHEAVDGRKRERLVRLAGEHLAQLRDRRLQVRYDIVSLRWNGWRFRLHHFPDAFRPVSDARRPWLWRT